MFNNKGLKWIYRIIMILPIIPIIWNIIYINQYSGFDALLRLNLSLIFIFLYLAILMFGLYVVKEEHNHFNNSCIDWSFYRNVFWIC